MPKSQVICPDESRRPGKIEFTPIPINQYKKSVKEELTSRRFTKADLLRIQRDMEIIRAFENMLNEIKLRGSYQGIEYNHRGPAHLSIGQEASAVGQAYLLGVDDHIYGSHRSHGDILAKGLSAIAKLSDDALLQIMREYFGGDTLRVVEKDATGSTQDLAMDYLVYGTLAEIFAKDYGFNRGMGGSMHAFFPPFGVMPNNAIVGGSGDISVGAALYKHVNRKPGIIICNIGDASAGCGPVWEGICFATMDQFKLLWDEAHRGGLPLILNFVNNFYGMGGQPVGETMGFKVLARLGAGVNPEQMHAERVDGYNPLAVVDAIARKKKIIEEKNGPVLLDTVTYRFSGHSPSDASSYREKTEVDAWRQQDSIISFAQELVDAKVCTRAEIDQIHAQAEAMVLKAFKKAVDMTISPRSDLKLKNCILERTTFSNQKIESLEPGRKPEVLMPKEENPRVKQLAQRSRSAFDDKGAKLPKSKCVGIRDAIFESILDRFYVDPTLVAYGEENRDWGGAFAVYRGLTEALPYHRLFNSPISEGAIVGSAVGYALEGGRPLVELMYCDFMGRSDDEPEQFVKGGVPVGYYEVPIGEPDIKKTGKDLTILTIGATLYRALDAARQLEEKWGISAEVIDARSIVPFNYAKVIESVKKTRKILLASDACERGSALQTMAAKIAQFAFDELDAPPVVVGARNWITPADEVEDAFFPFPADILDAVHEHILPLKGYAVARDFSTVDLIRRSTAGI